MWGLSRGLERLVRVLEIIASVDPREGGAIEGLLRQAEARHAFGLETDILCLDSPEDEWVTQCPVPTFALGSGKRCGPTTSLNWLWTRYGYAPDYVPWLQAHVGDYDIVVVNGLWNYSVFGARQVLPSSGIPYVVFAHGMLDPWTRSSLKHAVKQLLWLFCEGPLLMRAKAVLFTAEDEMTRARNNFWPYRVNERIVGYGTADIGGEPEQQINAFRESLPALGDRAFLLFLGRIHPKKGCDLLVNAFAGIAVQHPGLDLVIAGPDQAGWRSELEAQARAAGIDGRIHWPGTVFGDVKWGALRACDAFVLPSHQENFGVAVAEALAAGKPVLITNKINIWREIKSDAAGLVTTDDEAGVNDMLARFVTLPLPARDAMGRAARDCFLRRFEISIPARQLGRTLTEIVATHGRTMEMTAGAVS
jgi:glycosyltransferase involved in cell wall biosynthesis